MHNSRICISKAEKQQAAAQTSQDDVPSCMPRDDESSSTALSSVLHVQKCDAKANVVVE